jgi:hypothetical protein
MASFNMVEMRFNGTGGTVAVRVAQQTCMENNNASRFVSSMNENYGKDGKQKLNENEFIMLYSLNDNCSFSNPEPRSTLISIVLLSEWLIKLISHQNCRREVSNLCK